MHRLNPLCFVIAASFALALPASAEVLVGWGESPTNGGAAEVTSACLTTSGSNTLVVTLIAPADLPGVRGFQFDLTIMSGGIGVCDCFCPGSCVVDNLPAYWDLSANGCRPGAIHGAAGFPGDGGTSAVENPFLGAVTLASPYTIEIGQSGVYIAPVPFTFGHYVLEGMMPTGAEFNMVAGHEYYVCAITLPNTHTTDCADCCRSVGFWPRVQLDVGTASPVIQGSTIGAAWQGSQSNQCSPVPTRSGTWGSLKSAYR